MLHTHLSIAVLSILSSVALPEVSIHVRLGVNFLIRLDGPRVLWAVQIVKRLRAKL